MGYCQRLVTRDLDQSDRILDAGQRARVLNRADRQLARDVPTIPLFEVPALAAVRSTVRNFVPNSCDPTWNAENWWLDALALTATIAVSLLAVSGAGGAGVQTPRFGGTVRFGNLAEPACLNVLVATCTSEATRYITELILQPAFDVSPKYTFRPRLVSSVSFTRKPPYTLTYHIRPEARWSDGEQITAKDFVFTHQAIRKYRPDPEDPHLTHVRSVRALDAKTVRVVLRSRFSGWRSLFANVLPSHALQGKDLTKIWTDRIDDPRTGRPIGSGPFLLEQLGARSPADARAQPALLGGAPRVSRPDRHSLPAGEREPRRLVPGWRARRCLCALPRCRPCASSGTGRKGASPSPGHVPELRVQDRSRRTSRPTSEARSPRHRLRPRPQPRSSGQAPGEINPNLQPLQSLLFLAQSPYYRSHWSSYRYRPALASRMSRAGGLSAGRPTTSTRARASDSRLRFVTVAGNPESSCASCRSRSCSSDDPVSRSHRSSIPRAPSSTRSSRVATSTSRSSGSSSVPNPTGKLRPSDAVAARISPVTASGS